MIKTVCKGVSVIFYRQLHTGRCTLARRALKMQFTAMALNNTKTNRQPQARTSPNRLGGKKRFPQPTQRAGIQNRQTSINPKMAVARQATVQVRSVSRSVMPDKRLTTQKPLSFIQEMLKAPNPMARNM